MNCDQAFDVLTPAAKLPETRFSRITWKSARDAVIWRKLCPRRWSYLLRQRGKNRLPWRVSLLNRLSRTVRPCPHQRVPTGSSRLRGGTMSSLLTGPVGTV